MIAFGDGTNRVFNITEGAIVPLNDFAFVVGTANSMVFRAD